MFIVAILAAKLVRSLSLLFGRGAGATWSGEIALRLQPHITSQLFSQLKKGIIIVAGTNGKTTTTLMITQILQHSGARVVHNATGANLLNGITSALIQKADWSGNIAADWGVFEVDENSLSLVIASVAKQSSSFSGIAASPSAPRNDKNSITIVLLNLFRDQLDRYGEVDVIAEKWKKALLVSSLQVEGCSLILNADDPLIAHLGMDSRLRGNDRNVIYFGIEDKTKYLKQKEHATDSTFCLNCGARLVYDGVYLSHLGIWKCEKCGEKRPKPQLTDWKSPLPGLYNLYNTLAAVSATRMVKIDERDVTAALTEFKPAFGRQEEFTINNKKIKLFLSKNPTGFNASLRTILELKPKAILLVLNDRIPDGRDVSWIWDVDFEMVAEDVSVIVAGDRVYDLALRIKYSHNQRAQNTKFRIEPNLKNAITSGLESIHKNETLYVLPTYSAMLEVRQILTGKKIS